jgi:putative membrane protein
MNHIQKLIFGPAVLVAAGGLVLGCSRTNSGANSSDSEFVANASAGGMAEVKLGQLAEERGSNPAVKSFGEKMVSDHTAAGDQLQVAAHGQGMVVSPDMSADDRAIYQRLSALSGPSFDQAYATAMVQDHQHDISDFEKEASTGKNLEIRKFASNTLPTLREHLQLAQDMARSVGAPTGT